MLTRFVWSFALLAPAVAALGAEEEGAAAAAGAPNPARFELAPYIAAIILFGVVLFILNRKVWPVVLKALQDREEKIRSEIETAERTRKQAQSALQEYEKSLHEARSEAAKIIEEAKAEQQRVAAELRAKTDREISQMREGAMRDIEAAKRAAVSEIYGQMATTATAIASKILQRELSAQDQQQLVDESLNQLQPVQSN